MRPPGRRLPDLVLALRGQVDVDLVWRVAIPGGRHLAAIFPAVPVSRIVLRFHTGTRGG